MDEDAGLTNTMKDLAAPSKNRQGMSMPSLVNVAKASSSRMNGAIKAPAKGHPTIAPIANHMMPAAVFAPPLQSMKEARPSIEQYMAKLDGR